MNSKERYELYLKNGLRKEGDDLKIVEQKVNRLIDYLYRPRLGSEFSENEFVVDNSRVTACRIEDDEPINWGDLKCIEVTKQDDTYKVVVEEASPNDCPTFCAYLERYMLSWGWKIKVETEW